MVYAKCSQCNRTNHFSVSMLVTIIRMDILDYNTKGEVFEKYSFVCSDCSKTKIEEGSE